MLAVSVISTMKVDWPRLRSSLAPIRVKTLSTMPIWALLAGTKEPICARSDDQSDLADVGRFAGHIGAGDQEQATGQIVQQRVVRDKFFR